MDFLYTGVLISGIFYIMINLLIHLGLFRNWQRTDRQPEVTVLIAARNEAGNLSACLDHLADQQYPIGKLRIIILNDRSVDDTRIIARSYTDRFTNMEIIDIRGDSEGLKGKMNVLAQGMDHAKGEIIMITDADCRPSATWVSDMVSYFTSGTAMVGGLTSLTGNSVFGIIQACDWLFLQSIASGASGLGAPVSILGNNFAFRRSVYEEIGGFKKMGFSLTEDMALLQAIKRKKKLTIAYPLNTGSMVRSKSLETILELIHQRLRWVAGGRRSGVAGWIMLLVTFVLHLLIPPVLLLNPMNFQIWSLAGLVVMLDFALLFRMLVRTRSWHLLLYFPLFECYYFLYTTFFGLLSFLPVKIKWKDRTYP